MKWAYQVRSYSQDVIFAVHNGHVKTSKHIMLVFTGVAYDNFDRFVETTNGKDTLHDTVGIIYQNIEANTIEESEMPQKLNMSEASITNNENNLPHSTKKGEELLKPYLPKRFRILKNRK
ncbi:uncharacterized protein TNCV_2944711 [Trichonephila clavipes]|nr:uncharacterized protein TNCV_2944711 [Trichonephila clavipes]